MPLHHAALRALRIDPTPDGYVAPMQRASGRGDAGHRVGRVAEAVGRGLAAGAVGTAR